MDYEWEIGENTCQCLRRMEVRNGAWYCRYCDVWALWPLAASWARAR